MRKKFEISKDEFDEIIKINKEPRPVMYLSGGVPFGQSLQEAINSFWDNLGKKHGFDPSTIKPIDNTHFSAEVK